jgi:hypothetical protein
MADSARTDQMQSLAVQGMTITPLDMHTIKSGQDRRQTPASPLRPLHRVVCQEYQRETSALTNKRHRHLFHQERDSRAGFSGVLFLAGRIGSDAPVVKVLFSPLPMSLMTTAALSTPRCDPTQPHCRPARGYIHPVVHSMLQDVRVRTRKDGTSACHLKPVVFLPECPPPLDIPPSTELAASSSWQRRWSDGDVVDRGLQHVMKCLAEDERTRVVFGGGDLHAPALFVKPWAVCRWKPRPTACATPTTFPVASRRHTLARGIELVPRNRNGRDAVRPLLWQGAWTE